MKTGKKGRLESFLGTAVCTKILKQNTAQYFRGTETWLQWLVNKEPDKRIRLKN
jgi:hypothetical protein